VITLRLCVLRKNSEFDLRSIKSWFL